jgi:hypothetical protein
MVGDTGIEPVTPTVSTLSARCWLRWLMPGPAGYGAFACWSGWLRWLLAGVALHDRCTTPSGKLGPAAVDLMTRFKLQAVPPVVAAFHRGWSFSSRTTGGIEHHYRPGSSSALQSEKNARTSATSTKPRSRSTSLYRVSRPIMSTKTPTSKPASTSRASATKRNLEPPPRSAREAVLANPPRHAADGSNGCAASRWVGRPG